jgi:hypothetical protein
MKKVTTGNLPAMLRTTLQAGLAVVSVFIRVNLWQEDREFFATDPAFAFRGYGGQVHTDAGGDPAHSCAVWRAGCCRHGK